MKKILLLVLLLFSIAGIACPFCNTEAAKEIRSSLFGPDLLFNLLVTILPFVVFTLIVFCIYHGGFPLKKGSSAFNQKKS